MIKRVLSGNEAIARGAFEAGVRFASAYPGTPSTEILENVVKYKEITSQWAPNEKVSLEVAVGASLGGGRSLVAMKHVGLNVAADPLFSLSYMGVNGGLVIVTADDPGMHSSQNEQDNRWYARASKIPMLEPSDSQEAKDFTIFAFKLSEKYDTPILLRTTTRISHSKSVVELNEREEIPLRPYEKTFRKNVLLPSTARLRHPIVEKRMKNLAEEANEIEINKIEWGDRKIGIISSGVAYQYSKESFPNASFLKLGLINPLPTKLIQQFAEKVEQLWVVEELDPIFEEQVKAMGIPVLGKDKVPILGELNVDLVKNSFRNGKKESPKSVLLDVQLPSRPPVLCPGCSHRGIFWALKKLRLTTHGDIGCSTLGALPPLESMDSCLNMGASIGMAEGMVKVAPEKFTGKVVGVIGDSTFIHSGITALIDMVYNKGLATVIILDNRTTAMTGHQEHPGTGIQLNGEPTSQVDIEKLCYSIGIKQVRKIDPFDLKSSTKAIKEEVKRSEPSVILVESPCIIHDRIIMDKPYFVEDELCVECDLCYKIGCPAVTRGEDNLPDIDNLLCIGCSHCAQVCNLDAIKVGE